MWQENKSKVENILQDIIQENFPNLARQANIQIQEIQRIPQRYSSRRAKPRHIVVRTTKIEMKEKNIKGSQREKEENTQNQNTSPPTRDHNSTPAREQSWTENECDEMTESDFRRWVMRNFRELKNMF